MTPLKSYTIDADTLQTVLNILGNLPAKDVRLVMNTIENQCISQMNESLSSKITTKLE